MNNNDRTKMLETVVIVLASVILTAWFGPLGLAASLVIACKYARGK